MGGAAFLDIPQCAILVSDTFTHALDNQNWTSVSHMKFCYGGDPIFDIPTCGIVHS